MAQIIQITRESTEGLLAGVVTNSMLSETHEIITIHGTGSTIKSYVEWVLESSNNEDFLDRILNVCDYKLIMSSSKQGLVPACEELDFIAILDVYLDHMTMNRIEDYNLVSKKNGLPTIYVCNSKFGNLHLSTYLKPDAEKITPEKWLNFLSNRFSLKISQGLLDCLLKAIAPLAESGPKKACSNPAFDKSRAKIIKIVNACLAFYGFDVYMDMLCTKYVGTEKVEFTKFESYAAHNFERYLVSTLCDSILHNLFEVQLMYHSYANIAIIQADHLAGWALRDALKMANIKLTNINPNHSIIDAVVAISPRGEIITRSIVSQANKDYVSITFKGTKDDVIGNLRETTSGIGQEYLDNIIDVRCKSREVHPKKENN